MAGRGKVCNCLLQEKLRKLEKISGRDLPALSNAETAAASTRLKRRAAKDPGSSQCCVVCMGDAAKSQGP